MTLELEFDFAVILDVDSLVKTCYNLEGNGLLILFCYAELSTLKVLNIISDCS